MKSCAVMEDMLLEQLGYFCRHWWAQPPVVPTVGWVSVFVTQFDLENCTGFSGMDTQQQLKSPREDRKAARS